MTEDGESNWLKKCREQGECKDSKYKFYYDVDLEKDKILCINTKDELINFFVEFGNGKMDDPIKEVDGFYSPEHIIEEGKKTKRILRNEINILGKFFKKFLSKKKNKIIEVYDDSENLYIDDIIVYHDIIDESEMIIPKKGFTKNQLALLYNYYKDISQNIQKYEKDIDESVKSDILESEPYFEEDFIESYKTYNIPITEVDYYKVMKKYNGIYFTTELLESVDSFEGIGFEKLKDMVNILYSDTLMILNWIF